MFSPSIKDVMFDNLKFMYTASNSLPENVKLENKENMFIKYSTYHNHLKQNLDDRLLAWRLIEKNYVMQPPSKIEKAIGIIAALAGVCVPVLGIIAHSGVQLTHYAIEAVHLFKDSIELAEKGYSALEDLHVKHEKFFESQPIKRCVKLIAKAFTYGFRHNLLHMSKEECQKLSERHFNQIISVLEESSEKSSTGLSKEMFTKIVDAIDPNPKKEIHQIIGEYVLQKFNFNYQHRLPLLGLLTHYIGEIYKENVDFNYIIQNLESKIIYVEDSFWGARLGGKRCQSLIDKNPKLGIANPSIKSLINGDIEVKKHKFRNVFVYDSKLESCLENVLLLLMRWKIKNITDDPLDIDNVVNKQAIKTIFKFSLKPETKYFFKKILKHEQEILELKEEGNLRDEFLKRKYSDYEDYLIANKKPIISSKICEEKVEKKSISIPNEDLDKLEKKSFSIKNRSHEKKIDIENVEKKPIIISNKNIEENDNLINESLMEMKDVIKTIDSMFNSTVINLKDEMIDEILKGNLSNESLIEKINILFSPDQTLFTLETTFKQLLSKSLSNYDFFDLSFTRTSLDLSIRFWIGMLSFTAFQREVNQIENYVYRNQYAKDWKKSILFNGLGEARDLFFNNWI